MTRCVRVDHLNLYQQQLKRTWFADTLLSKKDAGKLKSLIDFIDGVEYPNGSFTDGATEFTGRHTELVKEAWQARIMLHTTEQGCKNQNHAVEREIGFLAKRWKLRMTKKKVPKRLWDFGLIYESELLFRMA